MKKKITVVAFVTINSLFLFYYQGKNTVKYNENKQIYNINFGWFADNDKYGIKLKNISTRMLKTELGFNDMLFPDKLSLMKYIKSMNMLDKIKPKVQSVYKSKLRLPIEEYFYKAFYFLLPRTFHYPELTDQFDSAPWVTSPMLMVNSFGFGTCGTHAGVLSKIWKEQGYVSRERHLFGHAVPEVFDGNNWIMLDPDKSACYFDRNMKLVGIDDLKANPELIMLENRVVTYERKQNEFPQSDAVRSVAEIVLNSNGKFLAPKETSLSETDWMPLSIMIPPNATFSFPFDGTEVFFAENIDLVQEHGEKVLTPQYKYAILEVEKGFVGDIRIGLYPFKIEGDCVLRINDQNKTKRSSEFDQINAFRSERIFAHTISLIEVKSSVKIYYLLNNYTRLLKTNNLCLKGAITKELEVALFEKEAVTRNLESEKSKDTEKNVDKYMEVFPDKVYTSSNSYDRKQLSQNLTDGKVSTDWISDCVNNPHPVEILFDLGKNYSLRRIKWLGSQEYPFTSPVEVSIALSQDAEVFSTAATENNHRNAKMVWHKIEIGQHSARYVKMILTPAPHINPGFYQAAIAEVKFFCEKDE